jgi:hypothetical protein
MGKYMVRPETMQIIDIKPKQKDLYSAVLPTHEAISKQAYKNYLVNECKQGESEKNWLNAEKDLKNRLKQLTTGKKMKA